MTSFPYNFPVNRNPPDILDKKLSTESYIKYMFNRTRTMFKYNNLPDTLPDYMLEMYLQLNGSCCIAQVDGKLYAFVGGLGGVPDPYYRPTIYTVANPGLGYSATLTIGEQCVLCKGDSMLHGLLPIFHRYAAQLSENDISIRLAQINSRMQTVISAQSGKDEASANQYINNLIDGKIGAVGETQFLDGVRVQSAGNVNGNVILQLIELQQYLKASWYNDIGLNANFNMKREAINEAETKMNNDALLPLIDDMQDCREMFIEEVNAMYGTDISIERNGAWKMKMVEVMQDISGKPTDTPSSLEDVVNDIQKIDERDISGNPEDEDSQPSEDADLDEPESDQPNEVDSGQPESEDEKDGE